MQKPWIFSWLTRTVIGFSAASFFSDFSHEMVLAVLPTFLLELIGSESAPALLGIVSSISDAAASFIKPISGIITDYLKKRKTFILIGYILEMASSLLAFAYRPVTIILIKTMVWIGKGLREPPRDAVIAQTIDRQFYGRAYGFQRMMDTLGAIVGPLVVFFLIGIFSLRLIFFLTIIPALLSALSIYYLTEDPVTLHSDSSEQISWSFNKRFLLFVFIMLIFRLAFFNRMFLLLYVQQFGNKPTSLSIEQWTLVLYAFFNIIRALCEYSFGFLSDFFGRKYPLAIGGIGSFVCMLIAMLAHTVSLYGSLFLFLLLGISNAAVGAIERAYTADLLPASHLGRGFGFIQFIDGIGYLLSSMVVGLLWTYVSAQLAFIYALILSSSALVLLLLI